MAKKTDIQISKKQKSNMAGKASGVAKSGLNKLLILANVIVFLFLAFQVVAFVTTYSRKDKLMFAQGRIININPKSNTLDITDVTEADIDALRVTMNVPKTAEEMQNEMVGPMPAPLKPEDFVGPQPAGEETAKAEETKPVEPAKPVDYKTANLSVIVTEVGPLKDNLSLAHSLPKEVSFAFSPYTDDLQKKMDAEIANGRMVLLNLMMQPNNFPMKDSGPLSIQVNYDENQNIGRFEKVAKLATRYAGLLSSADEMLTSKFDKLAPILKKISERGIFFGYYKGSNNTNVENDAKPLAADIFGVDYLVDSDPDKDAMESTLDQVKEDLVVNKKKVVIAIRAYPNSIDVMNDWLKKNLGDNIQIAPINYFVTNN